MASEKKVWEIIRDAGFDPLEDRGIIVKYARENLSGKIADFLSMEFYVLQLCREELVLVPGVGPGAATLIKVVPRVPRRPRTSAAAPEKVLDTTERIGAFFLEQFVAQTQEVVYQLCLDAKGRMICCRKVSEGDVAGVGLNLRRIVENALRCNAVLVALAHNHPSGVALPSHEDEIATIQIRDALAAVDVHLVDHIIVADDDYVSLRHEGLL